MKNIVNQKKSYAVTFNVPKYNAVYTFERHASAAFAYGNGTAVTLYENGKVKELYDTRYDRDVMKDFGKWCEDALSDMFNPKYEPKYAEVTE